MDVVTSSDGTPIAYEREGHGPALILVGGGLDDGAENAALVPALAVHFTVYNYARRGRGGSGDTLPYALAREIEDLQALITEAGGRAHLFGASSGGALVLEAALAEVAADKLAVYDVPYQLDPGAPDRERAYVQELGALLGEDRRDDALALFMRLAGSSDEQIDGARQLPVWEHLRGLAPTLAYDAACWATSHLPFKRLADIAQPTLVATSGADFYLPAARALADTLPHAELVTVTGAGHIVDADLLAPVLHHFFSTA